MSSQTADARRLRNPADRRPAPRQSARRDPALGADAGRGRMPVLPRRPARADGRRRPGPAALERARDGRGADRQRNRPRQVDRVRPQRGPGPRRAGLDPRLHRADGLAQPDDPVQGEVGQEPRGRERSACSPIRCCRRPTSCSTGRPTCRSATTRSSTSSSPATSRIKFNTDFDVELFVPPEPFIGGGSAARVMSLRDGTAKMSKSDPSDMSRINLTDSDELIAQKIRKAKTDPSRCPTIRRCSTSRPEARNLVGIYARGRRGDASSRCWRASPARASARSSRRWPMP